ncbi:hypothetical protein LCGC14_2133550 [marine sediment metagenome]|uniref:Uncharacterized protein n=1 Tax=marine sediment metagenome TaxID=412755 RepID=A0A0F9EMU4_9ZZZZ
MKHYEVTYWTLPEPVDDDEGDWPHLDPEKGRAVAVEATTPHTAAYRALVGRRVQGRPVPVPLKKGESLYLRLQEVGGLLVEKD